MENKACFMLKAVNSKIKFDSPLVKLKEHLQNSEFSGITDDNTLSSPNSEMCSSLQTAIMALANLCFTAAFENTDYNPIPV